MADQPRADGPLVVLLCGIAGSGKTTYAQRLERCGYEGRDVVVDFSFWRRATRRDYKRLIEDAGGRWRLVYLKADPAVLRERLDQRRHRFDPNAAFPISGDLLASYLSTFEEPRGEGEEVITWSAR